MKTLAFLAFLVVSHAVPFHWSRQQFTTEQTATDNIYILKVDRRFKGGEVEVIAQNGDTILKEILTRRKMRIDFRNVKPGTYTIKLKKGMLVEQFQYQRR